MPLDFSLYQLRSYKFHILKLKSLLQKLLTLENENISKELKDIVYTISGIKSKQLIEFGTDFFWSSVHYLDSAINKNENIGTCKNSFKIHCFDSFFEILPLESHISLSSQENTDLILPNLKINLKLEAKKKYVLEKQDDTRLNLRLIGKNDLSLPIFPSDIPYWAKLPCDSLYGKISFLHISNSTLYLEADYNDCSQSQIKNQFLFAKISAGIKIIGTYCPSIFDKLKSNLKYIIPFGREEDYKYPNFAIATLKKTLFLSVNLIEETDLLVAESLIHEYAHCELHTIQDTVLLTKIEHNILEYYSPWRKDLRPLLGLIHGIYISKDVIEFYYNFYLSKKDPLILETIRVYSHQVFVAINEIKKSDLTDFGIELIDFVKNEVENINNELKISNLEKPKKVQDHMNKWKITIANNK